MIYCLCLFVRNTDTFTWRRHSTLPGRQETTIHNTVQRLRPKHYRTTVYELSKVIDCTYLNIESKRL